MAKTAEVIAEGLRTAIAGGLWSYFDYLKTLWADEVMVRHIEPYPTDGVKTKAAIILKEGNEFRAVQKIAPDYHQANVEVEVLDADRIRLHETMAATLPDGTHVRVPTVMVWTFKDGKIVDMMVDYDLEDAKRFHAVIQAAGFATPQHAG